MTGLRFSLAALFGAIVLAAAGLAVLVNATPLWGHLAYTLAVLCLLLSVCAAIYRHGTTRAFCIGASLFGWCYLLFAVSPPVERTLGWASIGPQKLPTHALLTYLHRNVSDIDPATDGVDPATNGVIIVRSGESVWIDGQEFPAAKAAQAVEDQLAEPATEKVLVYLDQTFGLGNSPKVLSALESDDIEVEYRHGIPTFPAEQDFLRVGHCLFALLFALLGAVVCSVLYQTQQHKP